MRSNLLRLGFCAFLTLPHLPAQADLLASVRQSGKLRVAIAVGVPRFSFLDAQQQLTGSDTELAQTLASDLGVRLEVVRISNAERVSIIENNGADIVISSLSITPERERVISFSPPYAKLFVVIAAHPQIKVTQYSDLAEQKIGVTRLTSNAALIEQNEPRAKLVNFDNDAALIKAALAGQVAIISSQQAVIAEVNRLGAKPAFEEKFIQKEFELGIGIPKAEKNLRAWISNWVIEGLRSDKLNDIYRKHHGQDLPPDLRPNSKSPSQPKARQ